MSRFAPAQLTQATGEPKLPSLAKEGWTRHQVNGPVPLTARTGWFVQLPIIGGLNEPPRLRPLRRLRRFFLNGRSHPSFAKEGSFDSPVACVSWSGAKREIRGGCSGLV